MIIEVCADSYEYAEKAEKAGADRIELCKDLHLDGLTPNHESAKRTIDRLNLPVFILPPVAQVPAPIPTNSN